MKRSTEKYCVGCKLCQICETAELGVNEKGFSFPRNGNQEWLDQICPIGNLPQEYYDKSSIWGSECGVFFGWSNDKALRKKASSGGVISEIAMYLLSSHRVDGVIHICADTNKQTCNNTTISYDAEMITAKAGSRYSISSPLDIIYTIDKSKKYAIIGKPCDIVTLRNYQKIDSQIRECISILISFFCMGLPSIEAQGKLLTALGSDFESCKKLTYRGNGWPGFATAINVDGSSKRIDYTSSWGKILGRDVMPACRFCMDGIGEAADISCGDAWFVGNDGKPDFSEHEGRNIVFARTKVGREILDDMREENKVTLEKCVDHDAYLEKAQYSQFIRRASMSSRILALRLMRLPVPNYSKDMLRAFSNKIPAKLRIITFLGTCKRIVKGEI